jgi:transcriptional regulator with XRE-family HTH domain
MREKRGWTQEAMAGKLGTTQNTISRLENPRTGKPTIKTLLRIARAFDVGLLVRFVPFGFYRDVIEAMDATHIEVPSYDEEQANEGNNPEISLSGTCQHL